MVLNFNFEAPSKLIFFLKTAFNVFYSHMLPLTFFEEIFSFEGAKPEPKPEMNSTHPFYPILIPNTSYVKQIILFVGGSRGSQN